MAKITSNTVKNLAKLAKLNLSEKEIEKYSKDLSSIMGIMEEIKNLDVDKIAETARVTDEGNVFKDDTVQSSLTQEQALKNSKNTHNGYFLVPQILKED